MTCTKDNCPRRAAISGTATAAIKAAISAEGPRADFVMVAMSKDCGCAVVLFRDPESAREAARLLVGTVDQFEISLTSASPGKPS